MADVPRRLSDHAKDLIQNYYGVVSDPRSSQAALMGAELSLVSYIATLEAKVAGAGQAGQAAPEGVAGAAGLAQGDAGPIVAQSIEELYEKVNELVDVVNDIFNVLRNRGVIR